MSQLISVTWYMESPIDFEHKQYVLFDYLQKVDLDFSKKVLSPHLLHIEKVIDELVGFQSSINLLKSNLDKNKYIFFKDMNIEGEKDYLVDEIKEIVDFSIDQIEPRIKLGYKILKKKNQILF
jgi:hypothetical protein